MDFFYKPHPGVVGDCIPSYADGRYHVFYLRAYRDPDSCGRGCPWHHVSTGDVVHFEDHGGALSKGRIDEQDHTVATGCACTDDHGKHHIVYTESHRSQALLPATSDDLMAWTKLPDEVWYADESGPAAWKCWRRLTDRRRYPGKGREPARRSLAAGQ